MSESINNLAFEIMHTEDLGTIHALANRIYLSSLHDDLTVNTPKSVDDFTNDEIITLLQILRKQEATKTTENIYDKLFSESVRRKVFDKKED